MAIGDTIEMVEGWPAEKVERFDQLLKGEGLPSLTEMRLRFSKTIRRVIARGTIKNDVEFYAVRNAVDSVTDEQEALSELLAAYEKRASV